MTHIYKVIVLDEWIDTEVPTIELNDRNEANPDQTLWEKILLRMGKHLKRGQEVCCDVYLWIYSK